MNKLSIAFLVFFMPFSNVFAAPECKFPIGNAKPSSPVQADAIASSSFVSGKHEQIGYDFQTLHIHYKNGDYAELNYSYCQNYTFSILYLRSQRATKIDAEAISRIISDLYAQHNTSPKKVIFTTPLKEMLGKTLKERKFDRKKSFSYGMPEEGVEYPNETISMSLDYKPQHSFVYSSMTEFIFNIGAPD